MPPQNETYDPSSTVKPQIEENLKPEDDWNNLESLTQEFAKTKLTDSNSETKQLANSSKTSSTSPCKQQQQQQTTKELDNTTNKLTVKHEVSDNNDAEQLENCCYEIVETKPQQLKDENTIKELLTDGKLLDRGPVRNNKHGDNRNEPYFGNYNSCHWSGGSFQQQDNNYVPNNDNNFDFNLLLPSTSETSSSNNNFFNDLNDSEVEYIFKIIDANVNVATPVPNTNSYETTNDDSDLFDLLQPQHVEYNISVQEQLNTENNNNNNNCYESAENSPQSTSTSDNYSYGTSPEQSSSSQDSYQTFLNNTTSYIDLNISCSNNNAQSELSRWIDEDKRIKKCVWVQVNGRDEITLILMLKKLVNSKGPISRTNITTIYAIVVRLLKESDVDGKELLRNFFLTETNVLMKLAKKKNVLLFKFLIEVIENLNIDVSKLSENVELLVHQILNFTSYDLHEILEAVLQIKSQLKPSQNLFNINAVDDVGQSDLMIVLRQIASNQNNEALYQTAVENLNIILENKNNLNFKYTTSQDGRNILHHAITWKCNVEIIQKLVQSVPNIKFLINHQDNQGLTPLQLAEPAASNDQETYFYKKSVYNVLTDILTYF